MEMLRRLDRLWARGEGALIVGTLIAMVLVAGFMAGVRNLTRFDLQWANDLLTDMEWADSFLRKGTLWLAFLGASLATQKRKHIGIDILPRLFPARPRLILQALVGVTSAAITVALTKSFYAAVELNLGERPIEYEVLGDSGSMHICDAAPSLLQSLDIQTPSIFCFFRSLLAALGVPAETPGAAFQIIVPLMFGVMAVRFLAQSIADFMVVGRGQEAIEKHLAEQEDANMPPADTV